ncbi:uncharacterized protein LOC143024878 isoform X2 [Oratosquilla oratoria]|uniref:uncharacterized protein LOC143024878 isoform X2 n=1 Tax=Oratosquilla oratoria TaxID=337810 RepID=UPI003F7716E2
MIKSQWAFLWLAIMCWMSIVGGGTPRFPDKAMEPDDMESVHFFSKLHTSLNHAHRSLNSLLRLTDKWITTTTTTTHKSTTTDFTSSPPLLETTEESETLKEDEDYLREDEVSSFKDEERKTEDDQIEERVEDEEIGKGQAPDRAETTTMPPFSLEDAYCSRRFQEVPPLWQSRKTEPFLSTKEERMWWVEVLSTEVKLYTYADNVAEGYLTIMMRSCIDKSAERLDHLTYLGQINPSLILQTPDDRMDQIITMAKGTKVVVKEAIKKVEDAIEALNETANAMISLFEIFKIIIFCIVVILVILILCCIGAIGFGVICKGKCPCFGRKTRSQPWVSGDALHVVTNDNVIGSGTYKSENIPKTEVEITVQKL